MAESTRRRLDHVVHAVFDLDAAASRYAELGFAVTPQSDHPFGTSNRLVVLDRSYVELLALTEPSVIPTEAFPSSVLRFLERRGEGVPFLVFRTEAAAADHAVLSRLGLTAGEPFTFSRPARRADGTEGEARFSTVFTPGFPELGLFLCQHHTPDLVWDPERPPHPNGASEIEGVVCEGGRVAAVGRLLRAVTGAGVEEDDDRTRFALDGSVIEMVGAGDGPVVSEVRFGSGPVAEVAGIRLVLPSAE